MELAIESIEWSCKNLEVDIKRAFDDINRINEYITREQNSLKEYTERYVSCVTTREQLRKVLEVLRAAE